jgi:DNA-binding transcriptional LysR family regulator
MSITLHDVEVRHLSALRAVAEEGTFARAAERLGYTQSAVSQQISALERAVGSPLFERPGGPKPASMTAFGHRLLGHASSILDQISAAEADLDRFKAGRVGTISIGTYQSASVRILPDVLRLLRQDRPDLEIKLSEELDERVLIDQLLSRRLDATFMCHTAEDPRLRVVPLLEDPFVVVSPIGGPLDPEAVTVDPAQLEGQPLISDSLSSCSHMMESGLRRLGVEPNVVFRSHDNAAVQALVRSGVGLAVMPALAVDCNDPGVLIRRLDPPMAPRRIAMAVLADCELPPAVACLLELTVRVARQLTDASQLLTPPVQTTA